VISIESKQFNAFSEADEQLLTTLANQAANAFENARLYEETNRYAQELEQRVEERTSDLSRVNADLARALRVKDEFLASMSHELRTPLTGILGLSEVLQLKIYGDLNEKQRTTLKNIEESGRHLLELINDILDLSKIEAGKLDFQFGPYSVGDICQASLQLIKGMAQHKHQLVNYSPLDKPIIIRADARRLKQVLVNLLSNAIKFTPENGELGLEVESSESDRKIRLTVWDKGIGIKPEDINKIFKPFTQLDGGLAREYSGTGLGLSLVRHLTELHNGGIEVESNIGQGSRFTVILPWSPENTTPIPYNMVRHGNTGGLNLSALFPDHSKAPLVMYVDDNEMVLQMVADFLEAKQYRVIKVRSGLELLERAAETHPDIMLVDIQMPGIGGMETIRRIRAHSDPLVAAAPVIAVTALAMPNDREYCLRAGANDYMSKPLKLKELAAAIQKLLERKQ
jgi:signal transduction histidine kinase/CheY-like chemotaxis protein